MMKVAIDQHHFTLRVVFDHELGTLCSQRASPSRRGTRSANGHGRRRARRRSTRSVALFVSNGCSRWFIVKLNAMLGFIYAVPSPRGDTSKLSVVETKSHWVRREFRVSRTGRERGVSGMHLRFSTRVPLCGHLEQPHGEEKPQLVRGGVERPRIPVALVALLMGLVTAAAGVFFALPGPVRTASRRANPTLVAAVRSSKKGSTKDAPSNSAHQKRITLDGDVFHDPEGERMARNRLIANVVAGVTLGAIYLYYSDRCKRDAEEEEKRIRAEVARLEKWKSEFVDARQSSDVSDEDLLAALRERLQQQKEEEGTTGAEAGADQNQESESLSDKDDGGGNKDKGDDTEMRKRETFPTEHSDPGKRSGKDIPPMEGSSRSGSGGAATLDRPGADRSKRSGRGRASDARGARNDAGDRSNTDDAGERDTSADWDLERERLRKLFNLDSGSGGGSGTSESDDVRKGDR